MQKNSEAARNDGIVKRGRPAKYPDRDAEAERDELVKRACVLAGEPFDDRTERDAALPTISRIAEEMGITPVKARKLLIAGGFFSSSVSRQVERLHQAGASVEEIMAETGLGVASVYSYLPYQRGAYALEEPGVFSEQGKRYRERKRAAGEVREWIQAHGLDETGEELLWKAVVAFRDFPFSTSGRGGREGVKYTYTVSAPGGKSGRAYRGGSIEGFGNELWIAGKEKSISRSTVNLALRNGLEEQKQAGCVSGPKKLRVPGAASYLYPLFLRLGVISRE